ncbi:uncharacterized protein LOC125940009 [Dermacentor silvarum]|uniref:uncharacterized protein LOC125940009 n=1 Tax=Dermacentor silvarum TaxID=543639 RepID=UPI0021009879|nr:uncharacterized protein LOC125940009 [Dermacentor silvarum]
MLVSDEGNDDVTSFTLTHEISHTNSAAKCLFEDTSDPQLDVTRATRCGKFLPAGEELLRTETQPPCSYRCFTGPKSYFVLPERDGKPCDKSNLSQVCNTGNCISDNK